jgi:hypothetical protein
MKIAIIYICTGKYSIFWREFYDSANRYLLMGHSKHYFVFTDSPDILEDTDVTIIPRQSAGFPADSLMRFEMFLQIREQLLSFDYSFFFNSNMKFTGFVGEEIIPTVEQGGITAVIHPGYYNRRSFWFPYERRRISEAYVSCRRKNTSMKYFAGAIIGGSTSQFMELSVTCWNQIIKDQSNGILAVFHDESHINSFLSGRKVLALSPSYAFPEDWNIPYEPKIVIRDKTKHDPLYFTKVKNNSLPFRIYRKLRFTLASLIWIVRNE